MSILYPYIYVAVKGSLHAADCTAFGLIPAEVQALQKRLGQTTSITEVINGVMIKCPAIKLINLLCEIGYKVVCSTGEAEIVWTLQRDL